MSDSPQPSRFTFPTDKWGWFVGLGLLMIVLGCYGLSEVVGLTFISVLFIGVLLIIGGVGQILHSMRDRAWGSFLLHALGGAFYVIGGTLVLNNPLAGSFLIGLVLATSFVAGGVLRIIIGYQHREMKGWWMLALGGVVSLLLGGFLLASWPLSALWVLGTFVAVELIVNGVTLLQFGLAMRAHYQT